MSDDSPKGGFDDWLDEEPGPDTDPYSALSDDDPEAEISDWMAFTQGEDEAGADAGSERDDDPPETTIDDQPAEDEQPTEEILIAAADGRSSSDAEAESVAADDATDEIPVVDPLQSATTVDVDEFDGGARADTDEIPIVSGADVVEASVTSQDPGGSLEDPDAISVMPAIKVDRSDGDSGADDIPDTDEPTAVPVRDDASDDADATDEIAVVEDVLVEEDDDGEKADDTGEMDVVEPAPAFGSGVGFGTLWEEESGTDGVTSRDDEDTSDQSSSEIFDLSRDDYPHTATKEHAGLAAAIAEADDTATEMVALAAPIPGLESTVVGFEDVVEAEGHGRVRARGAGDLLARVITAVVLIIAFGASLVWRPALVALATAVFVIGAGEFYTALARRGRHPISIFGFLGIIGATVGAYIWGAVAIPSAFFLVATLLLLYYAVVPGKVDPIGNLAITVSVMAWVGLGAFAMLIAVSDDYRPLVIGVVVAVAAMDIAQYFVGRALGRHPLSPWVSPRKTIEGLVGGVVVALAIGASLHFFPPFELTSGLVLGAAVAVLTPLGDLAMSAAKRSLDIKDMGSILPGHGGFLDRIDGLIFVIPAAWAIFVWAGIL